VSVTLEALRLFPGAVLEVAADGVVRASNGRTEEWMARAVVGRPLSEMLEEGSRGKLEATAPAPGEPPRRVELAFDEGDTYRLRTFVAVREPGGGRALWLFEQPAELSDSGVYEEIAALNSDLAEAHRQLGRERARLARALAAEAAARESAEAAGRAIAVLEGIGEAALVRPDLDALLAEVLARLRAGLRVEAAAALLLEDDGRTLTVRAAQGLPEAEWWSSVPVGSGLVGRVAASRQAIVAPDLRDAPYALAVVREHLGSLAGAPMIVDDRLIGVLAVATIAPRPYTPEEVALLKTAAGRLASAVEHYRLWTAERAASAAAREAVKQRDEVLAIVAHDLRNPLARILMSASLLRGEFAEGVAPRTLAIMERAVKAADRLVRDLLDVSRLEAGGLRLERGPVAAAELLAEVAEEFGELAAARAVTLRASAEGGLPAVDADRARLRQALTNLVDNALRLTPEGGSVALDAARAHGLVEFRVRDTGPGIPAEQIPHLFDRFWQGSREHRGSSGLGLAIVKGVVDAHGGRVHVESRVGEGTTFRLWIPAAL
jgi:signal transduction histidine kinase